jgi:hypothetical protein
MCYIYFLFISSCQNGRKETMNTKKCSLELRLQLQQELYGQEHKQANGWKQIQMGAANMVTNEPASNKKRKQGGRGEKRNFIFLSFLANTQTTPRVREEEKKKLRFYLFLLANTHSARVTRKQRHTTNTREIRKKNREKEFIFLSLLSNTQRERE